MARRRVGYGLALAAALLFQIFYDRYLARYVLAGVVVVPILSLLLTLPGALALRLDVEGEAAEPRTGEQGQWRLRLRRPGWLPVLRVSCALQMTNCLTGERTVRRVRWTAPTDQPLCVDVTWDHCGRYVCRVLRPRLLDPLGLLAVPMRRPAAAYALVLPGPVSPDELPDLEPAESRAPSQGGPSPTGDYELRDYRDGDTLRAVHWKLSSKREDLVVREWLGGRPQVVLAVDRFGGPDELERAMGRLYALSTLLLEREQPHLIQWEEDGALRTVPVAEPQSLLACMGQLMSTPAPATGISMSARPTAQGEPPRITVTGREEGGQ
jgi:uncharacterized protein (DUF58 family)